jgi:D-sedoheptulose 7-phosphate isomerase
MSLFLSNLSEHAEVIARLSALDERVLEIGQLATHTLRMGGKILFCGNGGSAADAQHIAAELTGRFMKDRVPLAAIALSTDTSALTCIANDYSFDEVFSRQVIALGRAGDLLIGISTSGNSANVLAAVKVANEIGISTFGLLGKGGGALVSVCDSAVVVPSDVTARIQESHILIGHTICGLIEEGLELN